MCTIWRVARRMACRQGKKVLLQAAGGKTKTHEPHPADGLLHHRRLANGETGGAIAVADDDERVHRRAAAARLHVDRALALHRGPRGEGREDDKPTLHTHVNHAEVDRVQVDALRHVLVCFK